MSNFDDKKNNKSWLMWCINQSNKEIFDLLRGWTEIILRTKRSKLSNEALMAEIEDEQHRRYNTPEIAEWTSKRWRIVTGCSDTMSILIICSGKKKIDKVKNTFVLLERSIFCINYVLKVFVQNWREKLRDYILNVKLTNWLQR